MKLIFYMADLGKKWNLMSFHIFSGSLIVVDIVWMIASPGCVGSPSSRWQSNTWIIGFQNNFSPNLARTFEFFTPDAIHPSSQHFMCRVVWFLVHESYKTQILDVSNSAGKRRINSAGSMQSSWKAFQRKIPMVYGHALGAASSTIGQKCLGLKQFERLRCAASKLWFLQGQWWIWILWW